MTKSKKPKVSIIIPLYVICERFFLDLLKFDNLNYDNYEIIIVSDKNIKLPKLKSKTRSLLTGKRNTGPAEKRDIAIKKANGSICAFIDDDAYPDKDWLSKSVGWFVNKDIVAVSGPGITPPENDFWQKVGGKIIESFFCSGGVQHRYTPTKLGFVDDYPAYNLLVRKDILKKVNGYECNFYGGEDTFLCRKIVKYGVILYDPEVIVLHHRRRFMIPHMKQISNVGLHRGYFFKRYPDTSRKLFYFLPTILTLGLLYGLIISMFRPIILLIYTFMFLTFYALGVWSVRRRGGDMLTSFIAGLGIILTHMVYGASFVRGLLINKLLR